MDASKQIGGRARAAKLSPERRREIAREAAEARWGEPRAPKPPRCPPWLTEPLWAFVVRRAAKHDIDPMVWLRRCVADAQKRIEAEEAASAPGSRLKKTKGAKP